RANVAAAQGRTQQVRAGLLPNLSLSAGYTHQETLATEGGSITAAGGGTTGTTGTTGAFPGYQAAVTVRQLLFDFNHTRDLVRQAQALERTATATLTRVQADLV